MFCHECGTLVAEGMKFCPICGAQISETYSPRVEETGLESNQAQQGWKTDLYRNSTIHNSSPYQNPNMIAEYTRINRNNALDEMRRAYNWFSPKQSLFDEYDRISKQLPKISRVSKIPLLIWGIIIDSIGEIYLLITLYQKQWIGIIIPLLFLLIGSAMIAGFFILNSKRRKKVQQMRAKQEKVGRKLTEHYIAFGKCSFGAEYSNPRILATILNLIESGRADTVKEGINIMISDLKTDQMAELTRISAQNAQIVAKNSATAAVFSAASFFLK